MKQASSYYTHYPWSRATGWYLMALTDILDYLPEDHPGRGDLIRILQSTSEALLKVQDPETGLWFQVLNQGRREGNYIEGLGSAMFTSSSLLQKYPFDVS